MHGGRGGPRRSSRARTELSDLGSGALAMGALVLPLALPAVAASSLSVDQVPITTFWLGADSLCSLVFSFRVSGGLSHHPGRGDVALLSGRLKPEPVQGTRAISGTRQVLLACEAAEVHLHDIVRGEKGEQVLVAGEPRQLVVYL